MPARHLQALPDHQHPHITMAKDTCPSIRSDDIGYLFFAEGSRAIRIGKSQWLA